MGYSLTIYLGPYIQFKQETITLSRTVTGCSKCFREFSSGFCPGCGSACGAFEKQYTGPKVNGPNLAYDMGETLHAINLDGHDYFMPNVHVEGIDRERHGDSENVTEADASLITDEKAKFQTAFQKEIETLASRYGTVPIVKWGLITFNM